MTQPADGLRIISTISSATEIISSIGLSPWQVGRSHECDYPPHILHLPICTRPAIAVDGSSRDIDALVKARVSSALSVYEVNSALIAGLRPTHIITQTQCKVCAVSLEDVESALACEIGFRVRVVSCEPYDLDGILADILRVASACGVTRAGENMAGSLRGRIEAFRTRTGTANCRPRVACVEWLEPLMHCGNWIPELVELAGGENLFGEKGQHPPCLTFEELAAADPDIIICFPCGFNLARTKAEMHWLTAKPGWGTLRAVREGQVWVADGNQYFNRPGPRIVESLEILAAILHPELIATELKDFERYPA
jgi:iron complex transport system substrate-binding protein